jgi:flagellar hook-associated protein 1
MSGLIGNLLNATKSLAAQQAGVEVAGRNLANVNNPAYARQRIELGDRITLDSKLGPIGSGVEVMAVTHIRDQFLDAAVTREAAQTGLLQAQQSGLQRAESALGERVDLSSDSGSISTATSTSIGISAGLTDFFNAFDEFAANPQDAGTKQVLLQKADTLANKFNVTDERLASLQSDLTEEVRVGTDKVNSLLSQIADLNGKIQKFEIGDPDSALNLRDQRQARLEELSKYVDFSSRPSPSGFGQIQVVAKDAGGSDVVLVDKVSVLGGVSFDGVQISGGSPSTPLGLQGGVLKGQLLVRDGAIQQLRDDLKKTADQVAAGVNAAYAATGSNFFAAPPASGLMALDPTLNFNTLRATATADAGANEVALAVADVGRTTYSTGGGSLIDGTIGGFFTKTVSGLGESLNGTNTRLEDQMLIEEMTMKNRDSVSAVSMDEEMTDLMKYQRSYEASARVVRAIDEMLNELINNMLR